MKIKALAAMSLGLCLLLPTASTLAQSESDSMPITPTPDGSMTPDAPPEAAPPVETEAAPPEESITPESASPTEGDEPDANIGGAEDGAKLVTCGPNGAAVVAMSVRPGCHLLKVNSPPGVK